MGLGIAEINLVMCSVKYVQQYKAKVNNDHRSEFSNLRIGKKKPEKKNQGVNWKIHCDDHYLLSSTTAVQI